MSDLQNHSQPGILAPIPTAARYLTFTLKGRDDVRSRLLGLHECATGDAVVGFNHSLLLALGATIPGMRSFPLELRSTSATTEDPILLCWLRGSSPGQLVVDSHRLARRLAPEFQLRKVVDAFKFDVGRDLTGYEDGTENPAGEAAIDAALCASSQVGIAASSYLAVQQWELDFSRFDALSSHHQDSAVGRRRVDNVELEDAPASSHVKRTAQESFAPEAFLLRRSMPWADAMSQGLMFTAFGRSFDAFEAQLRRMLGHEDGVQDALLQFTQPTTSDYFWCPPLSDRQLDLRAIF